MVKGVETKVKHMKILIRNAGKSGGCIKYIHHRECFFFYGNCMKCEHFLKLQKE